MAPTVPLLRPSQEVSKAGPTPTPWRLEGISVPARESCPASSHIIMGCVGAGSVPGPADGRGCSRSLCQQSQPLQPPSLALPGAGRSRGTWWAAEARWGSAGSTDRMGTLRWAATQRWAEAALLYIEAPGTCPVPGTAARAQGTHPTPPPTESATRQEIYSPGVGPTRGRAPGGPGRDRGTEGILGDRPNQTEDQVPLDGDRQRGSDIGLW